MLVPCRSLTETLKAWKELLNPFIFDDTSIVVLELPVGQ